MEALKVLIAACCVQMEGFKVLYMSALDEVVHRMQTFDERRAANVTPRSRHSGTTTADVQPHHRSEAPTHLGTRR